VRQLVEQAARGDPEAFDTLAAANADRCYALAYRMLRDPYQAQDAAQQALIGAWRDLPTLRDPDRFESWLNRLVMNACYVEIRSARRHAARVRVLASDDDQARDPTTAIVDRAELEHAFRSLAPEQRAVVVLHHHLGYPLTEIAETLGIPVGTARSRLFYAIRQLRLALDSDAHRVATAKERSA
jgi:RNA polymerase sigma-70 factor, ECF subfamily